MRSLLKNYASRLDFALRVVDPLLIVATGYVAHRIYLDDWDPPARYLTALAAAAFLGFAAFPAVGLYQSRRGTSFVDEVAGLFLAWLLIHTFYRVDTKGLENIPDEGPCIVVCNHVSFVDAVVIAACVRRPIRFVMDHRIFRVPLLSFIFRTMRTIPIAPAREDAAMKDRAFAEAAEALRNGEIVGIFPEGKLTEDGELSRFRPGVQQMLEATPVPVVPMALSGLWGSFFSRAYGGKAMRRLRGVFSRIAFVVAPPVPAERVTLDGLQSAVLALRGERR